MLGISTTKTAIIVNVDLHLILLSVLNESEILTTLPSLDISSTSGYSADSCDELV